MKFLTDQDVYRVTVEFLRGLGYEVETAQEAGLSRAPDEEILERAREGGWVLITRDKGFGALAFVREEEHAGVILLRMDPQAVEAVHQELQRFLEEHKEEDLRGIFVVIEPGRHRLRRSRGKAADRGEGEEEDRP